jgi:hypothetical protein
MASAEAALIAALTGNAGVAALAGTRVFIKGGRQGTAYPYVSIQRISTPSAVDLDGANTLEWPRMQVEAWATSGLEAIDLADAIQTALQVGEITAAGLTFSATFQDRRGPSADEQTRNFSVQLDFSIWH